MPWGFLAGCNMIAGAYFAGRYPNIRFWIYMGGCIPVIIGSALLWSAPKTSVRSHVCRAGVHLTDVTNGAVCRTLKRWVWQVTTCLPHSAWLTLK